MKLFFTSIIYLVAIFAYSQQNSWPHIRGVDYNACASNTLLDISHDQKFSIRWKIQIGQGYSGCIAVGEKVYTQAQTRSGQYIICLDLASGKELWRTRYGWPWELRGEYPGTYATPTFYKGKIYFTGCYGTVGCLDSSSGKKLWMLDLKKQYKIQIPSFGYACTPLIIEDRLFLTLGEEGGSLLALNAATGQFLWKTGDLPASYASPIAINVSGKTQIIAFLENVLAGYSPETGKELWRKQISDGYDEHAAWPVYEAPYLFCASPFFRSTYVFKLSIENNTAAMKEIWADKSMSNDIFSSVIVDGYIYGFHIEEAQANPIDETKGTFKCIELKTGKEKWISKKPGHVNIIAVKNKLILFSDRGELIIIEKNPAEYREITRQKIFTDKICWTSPSIIQDKLLLRGGKVLLCLDLNDQASEASQEIIGDSSTSIAERIDHWLHQYPRDVFISPSYKIIKLWYFASLILLLTGALCAVALSHFIRNSFVVFLLTTAIFAALGPLVLSPLVGEFIFTWPLCLFSAYLFLFKTMAESFDNPEASPYFSRFVLLGFLIVCFGFYQICHYLFIVSGIGFLVGIIPAVPFALFIAKHFEEKITLKVFCEIILLFSVFFWGAALFILWKTH